ncbi:MAG TPA: metal ABC transporter ATP-binding protein [Elusimicrobiota bacterium]|jgi:zinc transport system ATP-binding protein|nr:metal ABC transporter ATP-binding protein [Elusimicrobiota bacterium]
MAALLEVEGLRVRFGAREILRGVSFAVEAGSSLAVIGPNGSGKTVLFRALIGALPHEGTVRWAAGARLGYVPQKIDIERDLPLTGLEFLRAKASVAAAAAEDIPNVLADTGLSEEAAARPIGALSGGQFQRLLLAFALVGAPSALILDEPTAGVDEPGQERLYSLVRRLQSERGLTVMMISHDLSVVYRSATKVLCLGEDHVCVGAPKEVLTPELLERIYGAPAGYHIHDGG